MESNYSVQLNMNKNGKNKKRYLVIFMSEFLQFIGYIICMYALGLSTIKPVIRGNTTRA